MNQSPMNRSLMNLSLMIPNRNRLNLNPMSLSLTMPRLWPLWWTLAVIVAVERVAENAHYPSDVVAGAALGVAVALIARRVVAILTAGDSKSPETN